MAVTLNTLSISLSRFDAVSDGEYNIGHIKLSGDGRDIVRTNNHKTFEFLNNDTIPPEETLAIKDAFCRALSQERLPDKAMDDIRARLGLKRGTVGSLSPRDMRSLIAAQVREILDKYVGEINANRASRNNAERVRTSRDIHRRMSEQTLKNHREVCDVRPNDPRNGALVNKVRAIIGGAKVISTDAEGHRIINTRRNRQEVLDEITEILSRERYDPDKIAQNVKLEGIDDDEIEGNLNIDEIEGGV